jgi:membrane protease YdiL (CAAX protease family)
MMKVKSHNDCTAPAFPESGEKKNNTAVPWIYLLGITAAEILVAYSSVQAGMALHIALLLGILVQAILAQYRWEEEKLQGAAVADYRLGYRFYLSLALAPMIRVLSLAIPLSGVPLQYWYLIDGIPLFAAAFTVIKLGGYSAQELNLSLGRCKNVWQNVLSQVGISLIGIPLGLMEFSILRPAPLVQRLAWQEIIVPALILLVFTGFAEELIFRGVILKSADDLFGKRVSLVYVGALFAVLHITHLSVFDVAFVFGVAVLFTAIVRRTGSLLGVTLAHGLTNTNLFIIAPLLFK